MDFQKNQMLRYSKEKFFRNIKCDKEMTIPDLFDLHNFALK